MAESTQAKPAKATAAKPKSKPTKPVTAEVRAKNGSVLFAGLLADAETYITDNFPRLHSVEAGPDFTVTTEPKGRTVKLPDGYETPEGTESTADGDE